MKLCTSGGCTKAAAVLAWEGTGQDEGTGEVFDAACLEHIPEFMDAVGPNSLVDSDRTVGAMIPEAVEIMKAYLRKSPHEKWGHVCDLHCIVHRGTQSEHN